MVPLKFSALTPHGIMDSYDYIKKVGALLNNNSNPLKKRFRALFTLKNLGGNFAIDEIVACFSDKSALLKHELAYCLGQMRNPYAIPKLIRLLEDDSEEVIVRHEAAEALGALGYPYYLCILQEYQSCELQELAETCELAVKRIQYLAGGGKEPQNIYGSVDPTPPSTEKSIEKLENIFLDENRSIYDRYGAMFALRDLNTDESILVLTKGLECGSVLFRHEVAFVLGQLQSPLTVQSLMKVVENEAENEIVRHESIEALGSIGTTQCMEVIKRYIVDGKDLVRESCEVALDMYDYENSSEFQYANGLEVA